jgi:DNA-binding SARP family transcriptional activator/tetratricopeptide (TPR) repeat protein
MEVGLLGPFQVVLDGKAIALGGPRQRAVLAVLALNLNQSVPRDRLIELVWHGDPPETAAGVVQTYVANLRKVLLPATRPDAQVLLSRTGGYELALPPDAVDIYRFEAGLRAGRETIAAGQPSRAEQLLTRSLSLWRGPALGEFANEPFAIGEVARLNELRLQAQEDRIEARLALGKHAEVVGELQAILAEHPLRERLCVQLMIALYRSGRQAEASEVYQRTRQRLVEELGMEPGPTLQRVLKQILNQDPALAAESAQEVAVSPTKVASGPESQASSPRPAEPKSLERKVVTALFADVVGSTGLASTSDPEVVRAVIDSYFELARGIAETHGGAVEKFAGDAVMIVFGVPAVHDDDAERAVRAGLAIREAAEKEAGVIVRVGINTGEAVMPTGPEREFRVSGDPINVAARLQQGAEPGEVVVGAPTERLTRAAIEYEPRQPIVARGKSEPLIAYRAVRARSARPEQVRGIAGITAPFVGRNRELQLLLETYGRVSEDRRAHLVTIVGTAGVGKSRLVSEALEQMQEAQVLRGRCLPYGRGITWWCFAEMLRAAAGIEFSDDNATALTKLDDQLQLIAIEDDRRAIRARLLVVLGLATDATNFPGTGSEGMTVELAWAIRHYLGAAALTKPVVAVIDDLQWAEAPVIETVQHLADRVIDVPLLLICVARPEFVENNPAWGAGRLNAASLMVEPLNPSQTSTLISRMLPGDGLPDDLLARIVDRSEGTPLYCEELLRMMIDDGRLASSDGRWRAVGEVRDIEVPRSIQAVLAARLDVLEPDEKAALHAASVVGERFSPAEIEALVEAPLAATASRLIRKGLWLDDRERPSGEGLRFRHLLIRDAAYESTSKRDRAAFHERFGLFVEQTAGDPSQYVDIAFHHAERAFALSQELMLKGPEMERRAQHVFGLALRIGHAALPGLNRNKIAHAASVAAAANEARPDHGGAEGRAEVALLSALAESLTDMLGGRQALADAERLARDCGRKDLVAKAVLRRAWVEQRASENEEDLSLIRDAIDECVRARDYAGELSARSLLLSSYFEGGHLNQVMSEGLEIKTQALTMGEHGRAAQVAIAMVLAAVKAGRASDAEAFAADAGRLCQATGLVMRMGWLKVALGELAAFRGNPGEMVEAAAQLRSLAEDFGSTTDQVGASRGLGEAQVRRGAMREARLAFESAIDLSERIGETWDRTEVYAGLAAAELGLGDPEAAERWAQRALGSLVRSDVHAASYTHRIVGQIHLALGREAEAEEAFRLAIEVVEATDYRVLWAEAVAAFASFCAERGRRSEALAGANEVDRWTKTNGYTWLDHLTDPILRLP